MSQPARNRPRVRRRPVRPASVETSVDADAAVAAPDTSRPVGSGARSLPALMRYFLGLGTWGFGGPIATVGYMQRDLVERRRWLDRDEFLDGVALGQTMPGPLAAQVSMWVGYLEGGAVGAIAVVLPFVFPSFLLVLAVGFLYVRYEGLGVVQSLFYGIAPGVMAIIAIAAVKRARLTNRSDRRLWVITVVLTRQAVIDIPTGIIAVLCLGALWRCKVKEPFVVFACGAAGLMLD